MGAAMEEARRLLYERTIKKFAMGDIIKHNDANYKNLIQMLSQYPNNGVGFKVWAKWWEPGTFFHVKNVELFQSRFGRLEGVQYVDNKPAGGKVEHIRGALKRGVWNYSFDDPEFTKPNVSTDNGVRMNLLEWQERMDEKKAFLKERQRMIEWIKKPEKEVKDPKAKKGKKAVVKKK